MVNKEKEYEIDEDFLLASIGDHKEGKPPLKKEFIADDEPVKPKDSSANSKRNKRNSNTEDYEELFLCRNEIRQRQGVYISQSVHQTVMQIVKQIAGNDVSVGGYIDNVLKHHLGKYKDEINSLYKQDRTNLID
mgnify:CR=1 FL=1